MVDLLGIAVVLLGAVLLFGGAALSVYGVAILGAVVGGGGGYLLAPTIGTALGLQGVLAAAAATAIGVIMGLVVAYLLLSAAVAALSLVVGTYAGLVVAPLAVDGAGATTYVVALAVGVGAAILGTILTRTVLVVVTSFVGASLASGSLTVGAVAEAGADFALEPLLFDVGSPIFLGLFALGLLTQFGLFQLGYVTKLVSLLPGAREVSDREEETGVA